MATKQSNLVTVGRIGSVFGIKGWLKIHSETEPQDNIFQYSPWWLKTKHGVKTFECDEYQPHGNGLIAHLQGVDDRDQAAALTGVEIAIDRAQLPELDSGEFYWSQLIGLRVITEFDGKRQDLGKVAKLIETGANDVLVVQGDDNSIDLKERLVPYLPEQYVTAVDLDTGVMTVDWDPEF
ncbi:ribosome maturation factor RimM [Halioxenophilus sp. WMMB6]|uniref:ribosome maturation factor RimM n=1 Tax=Halioxenophilus sp. WMMB6 TaxID=3073815 RepID=UPI00295E6E0F|nr:ribosome maturation factor RimM [Halioxenophilus sp. WMMB6]